MHHFQLKSNYKLEGDQPKAVKILSEAIINKNRHNILLGVTGSGKTFSMASIIEKVNKPTLIITPNKTLAGQLFNEFKELFPKNCVEYFVSYYDYYQPEAYLPSSDTYIEKDASINDRIDRLRHSATASLLQRRDVIVIASVSCIYGIGSPKKYMEMAINIKYNDIIDRDALLKKLLEIQYSRNDYEFSRGTFRVRGENVDIFPSIYEDSSIRITFYGDVIEKISLFDPLTGKITDKLESVLIFPASHYVSPKEENERILKEIKVELDDRLKYLNKNNFILEAQRLEQRTNYDMEMIKETGYCSGIENYSRFIDGRKSGEPPSVLLNFFGNDFLIFIDESHITIPQIAGMYKGDKSRKRTLIDHGFRLPSAADNRPLNFMEFESFNVPTLYVSATPSHYELSKINKIMAEQIIRPTGLIDPSVEIRKSQNQVLDLYEEILKVIKNKERVLVTTLTKKMAEKLTEFYEEKGLKVSYLHSDIETIERMKIISELRNGIFDVIIGINLLREGLDIPEVSLVAILEADREGFLRSKTSLIQTFGRAARNVNGRVILYADKETNAIKEAISETERRRNIQKEYNKKNNITPKSIIKSLENILISIYEKDYIKVEKKLEPQIKKFKNFSAVEKEIKKLKNKMNNAAKKYHFEEAANFRDQIFELEKIIEKI